jgi:hypothetical protein
LITLLIVLPGVSEASHDLEEQEESEINEDIETILENLFEALQDRVLVSLNHYGLSLLKGF